MEAKASADNTKSFDPSDAGLTLIAMNPLCPDCVDNMDVLGPPSHARWLGPDGGAYCSIHLRQRFGHGEKLVRIANYQPPAEVKPPAPEEPKPKRKRSTRSSPKKEEAA